MLYLFASIEFFLFGLQLFFMHFILKTYELEQSHKNLIQSLNFLYIREIYEKSPSLVGNQFP